MADLSSFTEEIGGNISRSVSQGYVIGSVANTTGIDVFILDNFNVVKKEAEIDADKIIVSGEALVVDNGKFRPAVIGTDTPTHMALCTMPVSADKKIAGEDSNKYAGFKDGQKVTALPLVPNDSVRLFMRAGGQIDEKAKLTYDSDGFSLVEAKSGDVAYYKALTSAAQEGDVVVVVRILETIS